MKACLPEYCITRVLQDTAHDVNAVYRYCLPEDIQSFIDLNEGNPGKYVYKDTFYPDKYGASVCLKTSKKFLRDG